MKGLRKVLLLAAAAFLCSLSLLPPACAQSSTPGEAWAQDLPSPVMILSQSELPGQLLRIPYRNSIQPEIELYDKSSQSTDIKKLLENGIKVLIRVWTW
jgi:hypothetical protein